MATLQKFNAFPRDLANGVHNFSAHAIKALLTNTAPVATNSVRANLTEIAAGGGYTAGGVTLDGVSVTLAGGTASVAISDETITATGGSIGPFRYVVIYNDTPTSPADPLIGFYDYGSAITLADGESLTLDFPAKLLDLA